ncbi:MAG: DUF6471 domain-containing protein [Spirochaetota bacterium]|nr:DUF6471 domain-containing protein [Spirochaetota bacterium]
MIIIEKIDWKEKVKSLLKKELKERNITYSELAKKLSEIGIDENAHNINIKISRGTFSAIFMIQCLESIGCTNLKLKK